MRREQQNQDQVKYCAICGRLISPHVRNFAERKYCSKSCSSIKLTELDNDIENEFVTLALKDGFVECGTVQQIIGDRIGRYDASADDNLSQEQKTQAGNDEAAFRERVRRAARRVVVNSDDQRRFVCWSQGQIAEPSFAKGEWSVKHIKR